MRRFGYEYHVCPECGRGHAGKWVALPDDADLAERLRRTGEVRLLLDIPLKDWAPYTAANITESQETASFEFSVECPAADAAEEAIALATVCLEAVAEVYRRREAGEGPA
jgi:hypothetical protein